MRTLRIVLASAALLASASIASAQSYCSQLIYSDVLTAGQWQNCFAQKQDLLGYTSVNKAGDILLGKLVTIASSTAAAGFNIPPGSVPTTPQNGDVWATASGLYVRINGTTQLVVSSVNQSAWTLSGNATGSAAQNANFTIGGSLTQKVSPAGTDLLLVQDQAAAGALKYATITATVGAIPAVNSIASQTGAITLTAPLTNNGTALTMNEARQPQGRLTLTTATPVLATTVSGATTVYYTPYVGNIVPVYDGTNIVPTAFAEVSQATTDATKSPAAATTSSNYDVFCWVDSGTNRCTRGPAWTSGTARGSGAGTTELVRVNGLWLNANAITNGPGAQRGTYVGTIRTNGSSTVDYIFGASASGGTAGLFNVFNAFNRVIVSTGVQDTTTTWTYNTANTWRAADNSATNRVSFVRGLDEDGVTAVYSASGTAGSATNIAAGIGVDSTTAFSGTTWLSALTANSGGAGRWAGLPGIGTHFISAIEFNSTTTASTWNGTGGLAYLQTGLSVELKQ